MRVRLDFPFVGVLIIIAHLVGETLTFDSVGSELSNLKLVTNSILISLLGLWQTVGMVQCTATGDGGLRSISSFAAETLVTPNKVEQRDPRLLKELTMLNRQSCLAKVLCGVEVAKPPSSTSTTMNDYAYIVKSFFDTLSSSDGKKKKKKTKDGNKSQNENAEDEEGDSQSDEEEDEEEEDTLKETRHRSSTRRKNSKLTFFPNSFGDSDVEQTYSKPLEELVNESDGFFFKRRHGRDAVQVPTQVLQNCTKNEHSENCTNSKARKMGLFRRPGFMGYSNPRFDKTEFLNKKQLQIEQAGNEHDKLQIAAEIADKLRNPRQCRLLSWLRPSYTTTTTITTTSNDPSVMQGTTTNAVNSMCPFTVPELQKMILDSQGTIKTSTTVDKTETSNTLKEQTSTHSPAPTFQIIKLQPENNNPTPTQFQTQYSASSNPTPTSPTQYQIYPKVKKQQGTTIKTTLKPHLTIYGESDPDLFANNDPFYSLEPPSNGHTNEEKTWTPPQSQKLTSGLLHVAKIQPGFQPINFHLSKLPQQIPFVSEVHKIKQQQHKQQYFNPVTNKPKLPSEPRPYVDQQYGNNFYLNSEGPTEKPTALPTPQFIVPTPQTQAPKKRPTSLPKETDDTTQEDEDEDDEDNQNDGNSTENKSEQNEQNNSNEYHQGSEGSIRNYSKMRIRIPNKIRVTIPSIRGIAANFRRQSKNPHPPQNLDPTDHDESFSRESDERKSKRQANLSGEKQLKLKTNLEFQETVKDQTVPQQFLPRVPSSYYKPLNQYQQYAKPPLPPRRRQKQPEEESEEDDEEDEEEERSGKVKRKKDEDNNSEEMDSQENDKTKDENDSQPTTTASTSNLQTQKKEDSKRRPMLPIHLPVLFRSKSKQQKQSTTTPNPKPTSKMPQNENKNNSTNGFFKNILSNHGLRTLSTITHLFYGSQQDEVHPHANSHVPPKRKKKVGPKRRRRPRPKRPRPQKDEDASAEDDEEDDESGESEEEKPKKKKTTTTPKPLPPQPLYPLRIPPKIVAVPIYLEGKEAWEGNEKTHEEEFFEPKPSKKTKQKEQYDYDDLSTESKESANSAEGVDFGPGQKINTEYTDVVNKVTKPGQKNGNNDRYILGLPTTWEDIFEDFKKQKENQKNQPSSDSASAEDDQDQDESDEEDGNRNHNNAPPNVYSRPRPTFETFNDNNGRQPPPRHHPYALEPID